MTLSSTDADDLRRYAGYPFITALQFSDAEMQSYSLQLDTILAGLTPGQETTLITKYLDPLRLLEASIPASGDNLDTDRAAVWWHNRSEIADRENLFMSTRLKLCYSIGVPPGPGVYAGVPVGSSTGNTSGGGSISSLVPAVFTV